MAETTDLCKERVPGLVSLILGTYNIAEHIRQTIDSLLAQTYPHIEIIVVDDGSTDNTVEVLRSYGDRLRIVQQKNGGVPAARNTGLIHTRGEFIALMDHDDICTPDRIAIEMAVLRAHPEVDFISSEFSGFNENGPLETFYAFRYYSQCDPTRGLPKAYYAQHSEFDIGPFEHPATQAEHKVPLYIGRVYEAMVAGNFVHPPTAVFRAELLHKSGMFDPNAKMMCDWEWLIRVTRVATMAYLDHPLLHYRRSAFQISSPRHRKVARQDTLFVAERALSLNPGLWDSQRRLMREHMAHVTLDMAYVIWEEDWPRAFQLWLRSMFRYHWADRYTFDTFAQLFNPSNLAGALRRGLTRQG